MTLFLPPLVFVAGKKRSGKDFIADRLVAEAGFRKIHIAESWLREWGAARGLDPDLWEEWKIEHRAAIQEEAARARAEDPMVLLNRFAPILEQARSDRRPIVVTAVRFINEALWGIQNGAFVIRVYTPDEVRRERFIASGDDLKLLDDPFERDLDDPMFPSHLVMPGVLPRENIVPVITAAYVQHMDWARQMREAA